MGKRYWNSLLDLMGFIAIVILAFSLISPGKVNIRTMQSAACLGIVVHSVSFFIFELKLFSKRLWVRRGIAIFAAVIILVVHNLLFYDVTKRLLIALGIGTGALIIVSILAYYIIDKIEERRLEAINKILEQNQKGSPSGRAPDEVG